MKTYSIVFASPGGETRKVKVPAPTDVQAGDAARPLMAENESIVSIEHIAGEDMDALDADPPKSQAAELAPVTPGAAAAPENDSAKYEDDR